MDIQENTSQTKPNIVRQSTFKSIPFWSFIVAVIAGVILAIYAGQFIPTAVKSLDTAAVSLSQIFSTSGSKTPLSLSIVPTATSTPKTKKATSTPTKNTKNNKTHTSNRKVYRPKYKTTPGTHTNEKFPIKPNSGTNNTVLHGLPNLTVHIIATGYFTSTSTTSFVATTTIPHSSRVAIKFSIKNTGTNVSTPWKFSALIPTQTNYVFLSPEQQALNPGDHIDYVLGFDQATPGTAQRITITVDPKNRVAESNENDNISSRSVTILGQ